MATTDIKYTLNGQLADNTVTRDDKNDKILTLVSAGTADKQRIISEVMLLNPGLERETVEAVVNLKQRVEKRLLLSGYNVNDGLYQACARFTGIIDNGTWNPAKNSVYISITQGADLRAACNVAHVNIVGERSAAIYVTGTHDASTRATNATATAGRNFTLTGAMLKVVGTDASVGITLTSAATRAVTEVPEDLWAVNAPSKLTFIIPSGLADGEYTLRVTTQYTGSGTLLKTPRSVEQTLRLGAGGGDDGGDIEDPTA